jgi:hypothetical protein
MWWFVGGGHGEAVPSRPSRRGQPEALPREQGPLLRRCARPRARTAERLSGLYRMRALVDRCATGAVRGARRAPALDQGLSQGVAPLLPRRLVDTGTRKLLAVAALEAREPPCCTAPFRTGVVRLVVGCRLYCGSWRVEGELPTPPGSFGARMHQPPESNVSQGAGASARRSRSLRGASGPAASAIRGARGCGRCPS